MAIVELRFPDKRAVLALADVLDGGEKGSPEFRAARELRRAADHMEHVAGFTWPEFQLLYALRGRVVPRVQAVLDEGHVFAMRALESDRRRMRPGTVIIARLKELGLYDDFRDAPGYTGPR